MNCLVCNAEVTRRDATCPECGDSLSQWWEMAHVSETLLGEGIHHAQSGETIRAVLALVEASVLQPGDPRPAGVLGKVLFAAGLLEEAEGYLQRAVQSLVQQGAEDPDGFREALAAVQAACEAGTVQAGEVAGGDEPSAASGGEAPPPLPPEAPVG